MEIEDQEIENRTKMADAKPTRSHMTGRHATVITKTGNQVQNAEIVAEITPIMEEKYPVLPIKPPAEAVEN